MGKEMESRRLKQLSGFCEGPVAVAGDDDMVEYLYAKEFACFTETECDFQVVVRGLKVIAGMIVNQNARCCTIQKAGNESLSGVDQRPV